MLQARFPKCRKKVEDNERPDRPVTESARIEENVHKLLLYLIHAKFVFQSLF